MMQGPIRALVRDRVQERHDVRLPTAWVELGPTGVVASALGTSSLRYESRIGRVTVDRDAPVLVMLRDNSAPAMAELIAHGAAGERVYVLTNADWGQGGPDSQLIACSKVLIRRILGVPVSGVLKASGGRIWMGGTATGLAPWSLLLDAEQADAFRQLFLRLFWHHAIDEAWTGGRLLTFHAAGERPFDVPELPPSAPMQLRRADASIEVDTGGTLVHLMGGSPPSAAPQRLWFPPSGHHHDHLVRLLRAGSEIVWEEQSLPDLVVGTNSGLALLPSSSERLQIKLNATQAGDARRILESATSWRFAADIRLGEHARSGARFWIAGASQAHPMEVEQVIDLPNVQAEQVRAVPDTNPSTWPSAQALALTARYRWTVIPPRAPAGTEEDPLIGRWRKLEGDWSMRLDRVREALRSAEDHRGRVSQLFSRLKGAILGFERTHGTLLTEVAAMAAKSLSAAGPTRAPEMLQRLVEIEDQVRMLQSDIEQAERKAREEDEHKRQEDGWRSNVEAAKRVLPQHRSLLTDAEAKQKMLVGELASIESEIKSAEKAAKKDLQARKHQLSDDLSKFERDITRLRSEVDTLERSAAEPFKFVPPSTPTARPIQSGSRFVPTEQRPQRASIVPEDALPEVGKLRHYRGQRYLIIDTWEALERAEKEASRLNARLVAEEHT